MKSSASLFVISFIILSLNSCKKDNYDCSCNLFDNDSVVTFKDVKEEEAIEACQRLSDWYAEDGGSCSLVSADSTSTQ